MIAVTRPPTEKILLDTDIGSDIDDALALAYLLRQPACELVGVTTVAGEAGRRAELASAVCTHLGRPDVPIHVGADVSMLVPYAPWKGTAWQAAALGDWPRRRDFEPGTAVEFMRRAIRDNPGQITLLAIGPLTNVGLLFAADPEVPALLKRLVVMGGCYASPNRAENNIRNDMIAASIVYGGGPQARPAAHTSFGLDVTTRCTMDAAACRAALAEVALGPVADFMDVWFEKAEQATFHDPLAAASIFLPGVCTYAAGTVSVSTTPPALGWTVFEPHDDGPHRVASGVDPAAFFDHYSSVLSAGAT